MKDYTRKIYAFAYAKTGNTRDAEDLSQDILLELYKSDIAAARDPDAWVNGICRHVWARFLNRNKRHWESIGAAPLMDFMAAENSAELNADKQAEYDELRQEIAYLSRTRREVLIMYYFDGKTVDHIARELNIAPATVRWHMSKARTDLKERLDMENRNGMREKVRLAIGHSGNIFDTNMGGLKNDLLTQNVAWACYGRKLTVEEIARELGVPAVYIENILNRLAEVDYVTVTGGRYSTNFFIYDKEYMCAMVRYRHKVYAEISDRCLQAWNRISSDIREIGFIGCDLPDAELAWHFIPMIVEHACYKAMKRMQAEFDLKWETPRRPDGSAHFVHARVEYDSLGDELVDRLCREACIYGIKSRSMGNVESIQYDIGMLTQWRDFNGSDILKLSHVVHSDGEMSDELKEEAAELVRDGYVEIIDGKLRVKIPYMTKQQWDRACEKIYESLTDEDIEVVYQAYAGFRKLSDQYVPAHIDENLRNWLACGCDDIAMTMWHLVNSGKLQVPAPEIARRLATVVWESK